MSDVNLQRTIFNVVQNRIGILLQQDEGTLPYPDKDAQAWFAETGDGSSPTQAVLDWMDANDQMYSDAAVSNPATVPGNSNAINYLKAFELVINQHCDGSYGGSAQAKAAHRFFRDRAPQEVTDWLRDVRPGASQS